MALFRGDFCSASLGMTTGVHVMIPEVLPTSEMSVLYLLHGLSDNCSNWVRRTSVERYAEEYNCVVVIPEVQRSFYADMKYGMKYFSYIADELPQIMHRMFNITTDRDKTYVAGLSMGGYGALKCAFTYPERYAGVAAFSAACDMQFNVEERFIGSTIASELKGVYGNDLRIDEENDIFALATKANSAKHKPRVFVSCGTLDILLPQNHKLKSHLEGLDFEFEYQEWEDDHTWGFWDASVQLALDFFFDNADCVDNGAE